jgi:hypothetical protein
MNNDYADRSNEYRKGQIRWLPKCEVLGQKRFIERLFGIAA